MDNKSIPPFYVGQEVVAIKDGRRIVKKGQHYFINQISQCSCGSCSVDVGINATERYYLCDKCMDKNNTTIGIAWCRSELFAPIITNFQHIEYSAVLEKEKELISVN